MEYLTREKIVAVIRADTESEALNKAEACIEGGIRLIEITFSFSDAHNAIRTLSTDKAICTGAGTVLNLKQAELAIESGAGFLVSPHTDIELIQYCVTNKIISVAGASTSNEIVNAHKLGADLVKIFPANHWGGANYIRAIKEPLPFARIFVTGGINKYNILEYSSADVSLIGVSGALFGGINITDERHLVSDRAKELVTLVNSAKLDNKN